MKLTEHQIDRINSYGCRVCKVNCTPLDAKDRSLPNNAYLLTLVKGEETWHDIVMGNRSDIFDAYYDLLGDVMRKMEWAEGMVNPRLWSDQNKKPKGGK